MKNFGFSLVELLVVVAIIGALAAAGVVGYQNYARDAKIETGAYNMNTVFRYMLNVRQQLPLAGSLGDQCEIKVAGSCADVNTPHLPFRQAFTEAVQDDFGFENPIHPECPIALMHYASTSPAATAAAQWSNMGESGSIPADCVLQTTSGTQYVEGAIYFELLPNTSPTPPLEYFQARMYMPCQSIAREGTLCQ